MHKQVHVAHIGENTESIELLLFPEMREQEQEQGKQE
jgi:hypothetical protein